MPISETHPSYPGPHWPLTARFGGKLGWELEAVAVAPRARFGEPDPAAGVIVTAPSETRDGPGLPVQKFPLDT